MITDVEEVSFLKNAQLFPNPSTGVFYLSFHASQSIPVRAALVNLDGTSMDLGRREIQVGDNRFSFRTNSMASGIYFLQLKSDEFILQKQLVVID